MSNESKAENPMKAAISVSSLCRLLRMSRSQFYFHVMAAYAILRKEGVDIGKADYVPHMFGYLRAKDPA